MEKRLKAQEVHDKLRSILIEYGNEEWGDCIIDEICMATNTPTTTDIETEKILNSFDENKDLYEECRRIEAELSEIGYGCEWGLDGIIYNVKLKQ